MFEIISPKKGDRRSQYKEKHTFLFEFSLLPSVFFCSEIILCEFMISIIQFLIQKEASANDAEAGTLRISTKSYVGILLTVSRKNCMDKKQCHAKIKK